MFLANLIWTHYKGKKVEVDDPWNHHPDTRTFEWETTSPPPHDNFATPPVVR